MSCCISHLCFFKPFGLFSQKMLNPPWCWNCILCSFNLDSWLTRVLYMGDIWFLMFDLKLLRYHLSSLGRKLCTDGGLWNVAKCIETSRAKFLPSFILIFIASFLEGGFILTFIQFLWSVESNFVCILPLCESLLAQTWDQSCIYL